jgi:hypothetical protein
MPWLGSVTADTDPSDGWTSTWHTPATDQNVPWYVRAVPFDDALNVQVEPNNQSETVVDGTVTKAIVTTIALERGGEVITQSADEFELRPGDGDMTITAEILVEDADGDMNGDGQIDVAEGENRNMGVKDVTFQYSLKRVDANGNTEWHSIRATQYSDSVTVPTSEGDDGKWQVVWQADLSSLAGETKDQYILLRAVVEDEVGHNSDLNNLEATPKNAFVVFNNVTGPEVYITDIDDGTMVQNVLSPHLAVSRRAVDVVIEAFNVAMVTLEYKAAADTWNDAIEIDTVSVNELPIEWDASALEEGEYNLRARGFDGDGNAATEAHEVVVIVDYTEPEVSSVKIWVDEDRADGFEGNEVIYDDGGTADDIYRYRDDTGHYNVKIETVVDATGPVEAKQVVLQYFNPTTFDWVTVDPSTDGVDNDGDGAVDEDDEMSGDFSYSARSGKWTKEFKGDYALGGLIPQTAAGTDGKLKLRILATDYAGNENNLDKGFELLADAGPPQIVAVYSGGIEWEGGNTPTIVAEGGDTVDLWVKVREGASGMKYADFYIQASATKNTNPGAVPVPPTDWNKVGSGEFNSDNGVEEIWHMEWTTPLNMVSSPYTYTIAAKVGDEAGNSLHSKDTGAFAYVKVEKDVTVPVAPEVLFVVTQAGRVTGDNSLPAILDEFNASDARIDNAGNYIYGKRKLLPISTYDPDTGVVTPTATNKDSDGADRYEVFDLFNDWNKNDKEYIDPDQADTCIEIWVRTPELEFGTQPGVNERRQYESYAFDNTSAPGRAAGENDKGPDYIKVNHGALGRDPGIRRIYIEFARDPNQDGDPSDITDWIPMDNNQSEAGDNSGAGTKYMDPRKKTGGWHDNKYLKAQEPLLPDDVVRVPVYSDSKTDKLEGYVYYWVMGDDPAADVAGETVWNTEASKDNKTEELDAALARDGIYFIRTWAEDTSGNGNPDKGNATNLNYGYSIIRVHNNDDIAPGDTYISKIDNEDTSTKLGPVEWKWHMIEVGVRRSLSGSYWYFGGTTNTLADADATAGDVDGPDNDPYTTYTKFFGDIDYVVVQAYDNESGTWVNVTKTGKWGDGPGEAPTRTDGGFVDSNKAKYVKFWNVPIDSTLVGDGSSDLHVYAVDNSGYLVNGYQKVHEQYTKKDEARRNVEVPTSVAGTIMVDNPRAEAVILGGLDAFERGIDTLTVKADPISVEDFARNGHDVGRMVFLMRRMKADGGVDGPWILLDAMDNDLDGQFGEDPPVDLDGDGNPDTNVDYDGDGAPSEDGVDPVDSNAPYMVHLKVPEWLVIDDPKTNAVETTADYWVVAVAGDANTGPLGNIGIGDTDFMGQQYLADPANLYSWTEETMANGFVHWDNPEHIIRRTARAAEVTIYDNHPPRTRILQVGPQAVPSETDIVVGRTVTVMAGDTEVDWIPPNTFLTPVWDGNSFQVSMYPPAFNTEDKGSPAWPAHGAAWISGMLEFPLLEGDYQDYLKFVYSHWHPNTRVTLRYAGPYAADAAQPAFPGSGESWEDAGWMSAEADAIDMDDAAFEPGLPRGKTEPRWKVDNWVTGGDLTDGKYYIAVTATDDVYHTTGMTYGDADKVEPDVVSIWVDNAGPSVTMEARELLSDGTLGDPLVDGGDMERGQALVLSVQELMSVMSAQGDDLDAVTFKYKTQHDYDWTVIQTVMTQPYSVTLSPLGAWSGDTNEPGNLVLGAQYQFAAEAIDRVGNKATSDPITLTVVDQVAEASISSIIRLTGANVNEVITPQTVRMPELTGRVILMGFTDADVVGVTFRYREQGGAWVDIEAVLNNDWTADGIDNDGDWVLATDDLNGNGIPDAGDRNVDEDDEGDAWNSADWLNDGIDNDGDWNPATDDLNGNGVADAGDRNVDEAGECGYHYAGRQAWVVRWDTTTLKGGEYDLAVVANTGSNMAGVSDSLRVFVDHNANDIVDAITDSLPGNGDHVGGWTRRPVQSENPILDPDDKQAGKVLGEVDVYVSFDVDPLSLDLDMGMDESLVPGMSTMNPSLWFQFKPSGDPDVGDMTRHDSTYWTNINTPVVYDAGSRRFSTVWPTAANAVLNGAYDIRVMVADEAGNIAYKVFAVGVVVDNTGPAASITSIDGDTTLTYQADEPGDVTYTNDGMDNDGDGVVDEPDEAVTSFTEITQGAAVTVKATAIDALSDVAYVQFQVKISTLQSGRPLAGNADEIPFDALDLNNSAWFNLAEWADIGLATSEANPANSYSLSWNTSGMPEGDYLLRVKATDSVGNKSYSTVVKVTVLDTVPPAAAIVAYYPEQYQFLHMLWPANPNLSPQKYDKYRLDNIYAATIGHPDVQEVQFQYRTTSPVGQWITIWSMPLIPFEGLDSPEDKVDDIRDIFRKRLYPPAVANDEAIMEAFDWSGLWGAVWKPEVLDNGEYELRAVAKDWSGNVDPNPATMPFMVEDGVVLPPQSPDMSIEFTADLGGSGVGDVSFRDPASNAPIMSYDNTPSVVLTVSAPEDPTVLVLVEVDSPEGLVYGGELVDVMPVQGEADLYAAALKGDELMVQVGNQLRTLDNYLQLIKLGGKITAFATTSAGTVSTTLTTDMFSDNLSVYPVTAELGTNGTIYSKDGAVSAMVPPAALYETFNYTQGDGIDNDGDGQIDEADEPVLEGVSIQRAGLMITPSYTPNTSRDQALVFETIGQAYRIDMYDYESRFYRAFRQGFEPEITIHYERSPDDVGFPSVRYWEPAVDVGSPADRPGRWSNDEIINLRATENTITFNVRSFAERQGAFVVPHSIFSVVLEKELGRIDQVAFFDNTGAAATQYPGDTPDLNGHPLSYLTALAGGSMVFRVVDPGGVDEANIRVYIDDKLYAVGAAAPGTPGAPLVRLNPGGGMNALDTERVYRFNVPGQLPLTEGMHYAKITAWDTSDAVVYKVAPDDVTGWAGIGYYHQVPFYIDRTPPQVVTHTAQRDGVRYFRSLDGATTAITVVDEGVGLSAAQLQNAVMVDVFKYLSQDGNTPMRTVDQGNVTNYQRKVLQVTSRPILEYADDYTADGVDNETWTGVHEGASDERHEAWRVSYTLQMGQIDDGDSYEMVFYSGKVPPAFAAGTYTENAVYLYEDLTNAYIEMAGEVGTIPAGALPGFFQAGLLTAPQPDPFTVVYAGTFLADRLGNTPAPAVDYFVRNLVADKEGPEVTLSVPEGVRADAAASTVSASVTDDASGIEIARLVVNGTVVDEKAGPSTNVSLSYTFAEGEAATANDIKVEVMDMAGNEVVRTAGFAVQETDGPTFSGETPTGDGVEDATPVISVAYDDPSGVDPTSVTFTLNGAVIPGATVTESMVSYTPLKPLKAGVSYDVKVTAADEAGSSNSYQWSFGLEEVAPSITDTEPSGVDSGGMPVISAKFADSGTGINTGSVRLMLDKKAVDAQVAESWVSFKPAQVLKKGSHSVDLTVADVAGNVAELGWSFNIEETGPSITNVGPSGAISDDMPILSASYSDSGTGIDLASVTLSLNGEVKPADVTDAQVSYGVQEPLRTGVRYTVSVTVTDRAGNVGTDSSEFHLEDDAPDITDMKPTGTVNTVNVAISANYRDAGSGIDQSTAIMKVDGVVVPATASASGVAYQATGLVHGSHTVYVEVADRFGNVAPARTWSFTVEQTPPTIAAVEPDGEIDTATPVLSATYSDSGTGIDVNSVVLMLNGEVKPATVTESQVSYAVLTPLQRGVSYEVSVTVADKAGNVASDESTFNLETTPPKISSTKPTGTVDEGDAAAGIAISAKLADDGSGVDPDSVMVWVDGAQVDANATVQSVQYIAKGLAYGEHTVRVVAADMLGNTADESWKFSVDDSTPPNVTVLSPRQDSVVGVRPVIKISYADEGSGVDLTSISVKIDNNPVMATAMAPSAKSSASSVVSAGEASYEVKLGYGGHTLTVAVKDVAGNEATAEVKFIVEGAALALVKPHNYPNPMRGSSTSITFGLSQEAEITIRIYDFTTTLVATVEDGRMEPASDKVEIRWDGTTNSGDSRLADGVYFCQILAKTDSETKSEIVKIALVRE